jgi:hypothetical protein
MGGATWLLMTAATAAAAAPMDAAPGGAVVIPFRTEAAPRIDPVFGTTATLRAAIDQFLTLQAEMDRVREEFSGAVHRTLVQLGPIGAQRPARACPPAVGPPYASALDAGRRFLLLGRRLETRFRDIRRSDDLGDTVALTPDYRWKAKRVRELYAALLRDYHEMRVAFHEQLGAELRYAGCNLAEFTAGPDRAAAGSAAPDAPDPANPAHWRLAATDDILAAPDAAPTRGAHAHPAADGTDPAPGPAIWIEIDNTRCVEPSALTLDGLPVGQVPAGKKASVRTRAGPHSLCVLPQSDRRSCGATGTVRRAYLYEGWSLAVRCGK